VPDKCRVSGSTFTNKIKIYLTVNFRSFIQTIPIKLSRNIERRSKIYFYLSLNHLKSFRVRQTYNCIVCTIFSKCSSALKNRLVQNKLNKNFSNKSKMQKSFVSFDCAKFSMKKHKIFIENVGNILSKTLICVLYQKACEKIAN
jgi:hypothetical protein